MASTAQETADTLCLKGTLLAYVQFGPPGLTWLSPTELHSNQSNPSPNWHAVISLPRTETAIPSVELHSVPDRPPFQSLQVLANFCGASNTPSQFCSLCKLAETTLSFIVQVVNRNVKQYYHPFQSLQYATRDYSSRELYADDSFEPSKTVFSSSHCLLLCSSHFISLSKRMLQETVPKALPKSR